MRTTQPQPGDEQPALPDAPVTTTHGVVGYGSLIHPDEIASILGRPVSEGTEYFRVGLKGWRRTWSVGTDNTTTRRVHYLDPRTGERPPVQVLFLNIEPDEVATVEGVLFVATPEVLESLDRREGNYDRTSVSGAVTAVNGEHLPDRVWAYVGKPDRVERAKRGKAAGSAVIRDQYLQKVLGAHDVYPDLRGTVVIDEAIDVVRLHRVVLEDAA